MYINVNKCIYTQCLTSLNTDSGFPLVDLLEQQCKQPQPSCAVILANTLEDSHLGNEGESEEQILNGFV